MYCMLSVKTVTLVAYSFYSWADHRRLLLPWPSVSSLINEKRFSKFFLEFLIGLFYFSFCFLSVSREKSFGGYNVGWLLTFFITACSGSQFF